MKKEVLFLAYQLNDVKVLKHQSKEIWNLSYALNGVTAKQLINDKIYDFILIDSASEKYEAFKIVSQLQSQKVDSTIFILTREDIKEFEKNISFSYAKIFKIPYTYSELQKSILDYMNKIKENCRDLESKLIGASPIIQNLRQFIKKVAMKEFPVMLYGESGSGKDLVANLIHETSNNNTSPFVPINVNTIPQNLAESILFGTEKGAFTDAVSSTGIFQQGSGGTVFLDEIESMDIHVQAKFLRVLETKKIKKLGSSKTQNCNFRIISASNRSLKKAVEKKLFREDLYYRLDVLRYIIPPLRKHKEDIVLIANNYLKEYHKVISSSSVEKLSLYSWPGNIRELHNCLARAIFYSENKEKILPKHIRF